MSRSLKPIPNENVQAMFKGLPEGLDGELIFGDPCSPSAYRDTVSIVMSDDKPVEGVCLWMFDKFSDAPFKSRIAKVEGIVKEYADAFGGAIVFVQHMTINSIEELDQYEADALAEKNEGVMIRSMDGPYKQGRSSEREAYLLKLKRFSDAEARIVSSYELMHNSNDSFKNELGRTARSTAKEGLVGTETLGGFEVVGAGEDYNGVAFSIGTGFDAKMRQSFWKDREKLIGQLVKFKYFPSGSKDRPRHPIFIGFRDDRDL
jgi:DNA ligase-1